MKTDTNVSVSGVDMMTVSAHKIGGPKGVGPLVMANGGTSYRAFLEGRVDGDRYALILRLTNLELKPLNT